MIVAPDLQHTRTHITTHRKCTAKERDAIYLPPARSHCRPSRRASSPTGSSPSGHWSPAPDSPSGPCKSAIAHVARTAAPAALRDLIQRLLLVALAPADELVVSRGLLPEIVELDDLRDAPRAQLETKQPATSISSNRRAAHIYPLLLDHAEVLVVNLEALLEFDTFLFRPRLDDRGQICRAVNATHATPAIRTYLMV